MTSCAACSAELRAGARFCTRCGTAAEASQTALPVPLTVDPSPGLADEPGDEIPPSMPPRGRYTPPPHRSTAATWALVTGVAPLIVSVAGNLVAAQFGASALGQSGALAPIFLTLTIVFVANAALLTVCGITGGRGIRETANGITRGRGLAVAGLAAGGVNLVLWTAGLVVTVGGLNAVLL